MSSKPPGMSEFSAMSMIAKARRANLRTMFTGTRLTFGKYTREKLIKNSGSSAVTLGSNVKKLIQGVKSGTSTATAVAQSGDTHTAGREFLQLATGIPDFSDVVDAIGAEVVQSLIGEMMPFLGIVTSGLKAASSWRQVVRNAHDLYRADYYLQGVLPGDPSAAAEAVIECIQRFLASNTAEAIRNTAAAGTKIAGLFADFGTVTTAAVGAASALTKLIMELSILGRDYSEMKKGNELLKDPSTLDMNLFKVCPILGCYLIACSDSSMILNFFVADIGLPGWMSKVEHMKKTQLDPLIRNASRAIVSSHLTLDGLKANKGSFESKGIFSLLKDGIKLKFNQLIKSNSTNALAGPS